MPRYLMTISYDGSAFHGWQIQDNAYTVQAAIQRAMEVMCKTHINVVGSGRTDTGVHALAQTAHFDYEGSMSPEQMVRALNRLLANPVRICDIKQVPDDFHARYNACERHYRYLLSKEPDPFTRLYRGFVPHQRIDLDSMLAAVPFLLGSHDFSS
ncbi:MAG: tRNA pseudouridine synthase A, partial [Candidatus Cloacimonadaceae bacterium]|nr:tRNA pseudouridine synthase A [Candidatus Cloacimonadaceae bacterium]